MIIMKSSGSIDFESTRKKVINASCLINSSNFPSLYRQVLMFMYNQLLEAIKYKKVRNFDINGQLDVFEIQISQNVFIVKAKFKRTTAMRSFKNDEDMNRLVETISLELYERLGLKEIKSSDEKVIKWHWEK